MLPHMLKIWKTQSIPIPTKIRLLKALVWPVATYGCESWTLRKNKVTRLDAFEMKGLRKILRVSWTAKKTNEWVLNKAWVERELLDTVKARKLAYYGYTMRKQVSCLEKEIMRGTMPGARRWGRPRTAWMYNINTGLPWKSQSEWQRTEIIGESTSIVWPTLGSRTAKEQNRSLCAKILQIDLFSRFDCTSTCDGQTGRHRAVANTAIYHSVSRLKMLRNENEKGQRGGRSAFLR